jgi:hypothetical protein
MQNNLYDFSQLIQNRTQQPSQEQQPHNWLMDPIIMAGYGIARGQPISEAITQASALQHQQADSALKQQQIETEKQQNARVELLSQYLSSINPQLGALYGGDPRNAGALFEALNPNPLKDTFKGQGGALYKAEKNPETGTLKASLIEGQRPEQSELTAAEKRTQATEKAEFARAAAAGTKELRILHDLEKAFKGYDEASAAHTRAGGLIASTKKLPFLNEEQTNATLYNKKQLTYKNEIDKLNSQLYQARIASVPAATDVFKVEVEKGLPRTSVTKEARDEVIRSKKREVAQAIIRNKFFNDWAKFNNGDRTGAEDAVRYIEDNYDIVNERGEINKELLKQLPFLAAELLAQEKGGNFNSNSFSQSNNPLNEDEFNDLINDDGFLKYLQNKGQ